MGAVDTPQPWATYHSTEFTKHNENILKWKILKKKPHLTHFRLVITQGPIEQERPTTQKATDLRTAYSQHIKQNRGWKKLKNLTSGAKIYFFKWPSELQAERVW